jgi:5-methylcytosine-specific restriction endonuclease McrA
LMKAISCLSAPFVVQKQPVSLPPLPYTLKVQGSIRQVANEHKLLLKNPEKRFGICAVCGPTRLKKKQQGYWSCRTKSNSNRVKLLKYKKPHCEACGFVAIHRSQLDIDHIDGDHSNNSLNNLQTLCANCHRLKTQTNKDWA